MVTQVANQRSHGVVIAGVSCIVVKLRIIVRDIIPGYHKERTKEVEVGSGATGPRSLVERNV